MKKQALKKYLQIWGLNKMVRVEKTQMIFCTCGTEAIGIDYDKYDDTTSF